MTDLVAIADAVDRAVPESIRAEWDLRAGRRPAHLVRGRVFWSCGRPFARVLGSRSELPTQLARTGDADGARTDEGALAADLRSAFRDLAAAADSLPVLVPVSRVFLSGDLPLPVRPDRVVVEVDGARECDAVVRDGVLRLKALGCRVALGGFTGRADQRRLLPLADLVKIDSRDLDVEGQPLLDLAASRGADLVAEFVDTDEALAECRAAGFALVQGRALERRAPVSRSFVLASGAGR